MYVSHTYILEVDTLTLKQLSPYLTSIMHFQAYLTVKQRKQDCHWLFIHFLTQYILRSSMCQVLWDPTENRMLSLPTRSSQSRILILSTSWILGESQKPRLLVWVKDSVWYEDEDGTNKCPKAFWPKSSKTRRPMIIQIIVQQSFPAPFTLGRVYFSAPLILV